jgi:2-oxo-4-hydroxy-4-carboxy-5-ureidoimidazoline decarboxylase
LNDSPTSDARPDLDACCGSTAWVDRMLAARPFANDDAVVESALAIWRSLSREDWLEAFARHPRIGARATSDWSAREQSGMMRATESVRARIDALNREYEARFGHVFLICATGLSGEEMLAALHRRLSNEPEAEVRVGAAEQAKITRLRLGKLT